ncbi:hypothetical protein EYS14_02280 [Alteromonadaceae bacterium M269]|nr:hypothetical protein EYS14_02280 [Alteromonadaceae bacterium M269]
MTISLYTLDKEGVYDLVFLGILITVGGLFYRNNDILSICIVLIALSISLELLWLLREHEAFRWLTYLLAIAICYWLRESLLTRYVIAIILIELGAYIYYLSFEYARIPGTDWFLMSTCLGLVYRRLFFMRDVYLSPLFKHLSDTQLDFKLYKIFGYGLILNGLMVIEYTARHALGISIQIVYDSHPYIIRLLTALVLFYIINFSSEDVYKRYF